MERNVRSSDQKYLYTILFIVIFNSLVSVSVPVLLIEGSPSILASSGSNISLTCRLKGGTGAGSLAQLQWWAGCLGE